MIPHYTDRWPELKGLIAEFDERIAKISLPPEHVVLDDFDVQQMLKISKRKLAQLRAERKIKFYRTDDESLPKKVKAVHQSGRRKSKIYYLLVDVLNYVKRNPVNPIIENLKFN